MKKHIFVLIFSFLTSFLFSQTRAKLDSLENALKSFPKDDTNKVNTLNELTWQYRKIDLDKAQAYGNEALKISEKIKWDAGKARAYSRLGSIFTRRSNLVEARESYLKSLAINKALNNKNAMAGNYSNLAYIYEEENNYKAAIEENEKALKMFMELNNKVDIASSLINIGTVYMWLDNYSLALEYYLKALNIAEEINNIESKSVCYNNIGLIYKTQKRYDKALECFLKTLKIKENLNDPDGVSDSYNNIGAMYKLMENYDIALEYFFKTLKIEDGRKNKKGMALAYGNIGIVYRIQNKSDLSLEYQLKALSIKQELNDRTGLITAHNNLGVFYTKQNRYEEAIKHHQKALEIATAINKKDGIREGYKGLFTVYDLQKNHEKALEYFKLSTAINDSIYTLESTKQMAEMQTKYETEKKGKEINLLTKEREIQNLQFQKQQLDLIKQRLESKSKEGEIALLNTGKKIQQMTLEQQKHDLKQQKMQTEAKNKEVVLLNKDKKIQQAELSRQKTFRNSITAGFGLIFILAIVSYRGYRLKQKANKLLGHQKDIIEEKNKDIMDSIHYANRIQTALLKEEEHITEHLPPHFILFRPKDILSGDFYWSLEKQGHLYVAAADCTGHGVPGAMMSMLGIAFLNEITGTEKLQTPAEILDQLRDKIIKDLKSKDGVTKDGMDISLIRLELSSPNGEGKPVLIGAEGGLRLQWSGANNPLWIVKSSGTATEILEVKPNKQPIGFSHELKPFTNHEISLGKGDTLYLFTDGYADQFGGEKGKKFKYAKLKELLVNINDKTIPDQKEILNTTFESWKGNLEQVDDVCIIGVRI